ncbi:MAG: hypothetical protein WCG83_02510, partial [Candidatus Peregrinibacteria bacterium]
LAPSRGFSHATGSAGSTDFSSITSSYRHFAPIFHEENQGSKRALLLAKCDPENPIGAGNMDLEADSYPRIACSVVLFMRSRIFASDWYVNNCNKLLTKNRTSLH